MTFALQAAFTDNASTIPAAVLNAWRVDINRALDGVNGGTYTLLAPLEIAGDDFTVSSDAFLSGYVTWSGDGIISGAAIAVEDGASLDLDTAEINLGSDAFLNVNSGGTIDLNSGGTLVTSAGSTVSFALGTWTSGIKLASSVATTLPSIDMLTPPTAGERKPHLRFAINSSLFANIVGDDTSDGASLLVNATVSGANYAKESNDTAARLFLSKTGVLEVSAKATGSGTFAAFDASTEVRLAPGGATPIAHAYQELNIPRAWALVSTTGSGITGSDITLHSSFNVTSVAFGSGSNPTWVEINFTIAMANTNYAVLVTDQNSNVAQFYCVSSKAQSTTQARASFAVPSAGGTALDLGATATKFSILVFGAT